MQQLKLPFLGLIQINKSLDEQNYQCFFEYENVNIELNLIFEPENTSLNDLTILKDFLDNFDYHAKTAFQAILKDIKKSGEAKDFIQTHIDALTPMGKEVLKETLAKNISLEEFFVEDLELNLIYMFADDLEEFINLNYQISEEFTDEVLVVRLGRDLKVKEIFTEY